MNDLSYLSVIVAVGFDVRETLCERVVVLDRCACGVCVCMHR